MTLMQPRKQRLGQFQNVLPALAQWGDAEAEQIEPVKKVFSKLALGDKFLQVPVARGNDARVHGNLAGAAQPPDFPVFDRHEDLRLKPEGQTRQLVQEQRAAVGRFKQSHARGPGVRECATFVAEQLGFGQRLRQRRAVDLDQRLRRPRPLPMQPTSDGGFACASLALDEDG